MKARLAQWIEPALEAVHWPETIQILKLRQVFIPQLERGNPCGYPVQSSLRPCLCPVVSGWFVIRFQWMRSVFAYTTQVKEFLEFLTKAQCVLKFGKI